MSLQVKFDNNVIRSHLYSGKNTHNIKTCHLSIYLSSSFLSQWSYFNENFVFFFVRDVKSEFVFNIIGLASIFTEASVRKAVRIEILGK